MATPSLTGMPEWRKVERLGIGREVYVHPDLDDRQFLYRYSTIETVAKTFASGRFRMYAPREWDDPYETWWCDQLFAEGSSLRAARPYGLCWTTRNRDEPIWRLYTCPQYPKVPAVRLRTRVDRLVARAMAMIRENQGKAFLGRIRYRKKGFLEAQAERYRSTPHKLVAQNAATGLHWKRTQFSLEREIRLLWIETADVAHEYRELQFDRESLIDQVMVGPTTDPKKAEAAKRTLIEAMVPERLLCISDLYRRRSVPGPSGSKMASEARDCVAS